LVAKIIKFYVYRVFVQDFNLDYNFLFSCLYKDITVSKPVSFGSYEIDLNDDQAFVASKSKPARSSDVIAISKKL